MKKEINALLLLIAFPILYLGGALNNVIISQIGILITVIDAVLIMLPSQRTKTSA